jgi:hypothetical protein
LEGELSRRKLIKRDCLEKLFKHCPSIWMRANIVDLLPLEIWLRQVKSLKGGGD